MLDHFLEASYGRTKEAEAKASLTATLEQLPDELLYKIASGEEKLAYMDSSSGEWLEKFKGTPLFQKAYDLEKADLQMQMQEKNERQEERAAQDQRWKARDAARDEICIHRKMLDLELAALEEGVEPPTEETPVGGLEQEAAEEGESVEHEAAEAPAEEAAEHAEGGKEASADLAFMAAKMKMAKVLTMKGRTRIKEKNFAIPKGKGPGGTGKYPIHDEQHARTALTYVARHGTPEEKAQVHSAVAKKYPGLAARSSVPGVKEKAKTAGSVVQFPGKAERMARAAKKALGKKSLLGEGSLGQQFGEHFVGGKAPGRKLLLAAGGAGAGYGALNAKSRVGAMTSKQKAKAEEEGPGSKALIRHPGAVGAATGGASGIGALMGGHLGATTARRLGKSGLAGTALGTIGGAFAPLVPLVAANVAGKAKSKEAMAKEAFTAALAKGLAGGAGKALLGAGKTLAQGATRTGAAFQRGGMMPALRTAGRSALTFAGKHPGVTAGAAGLGAGMALG